MYSLHLGFQLKLRTLVLLCLGLLLVAPSWAEQGTCPHAEGWKPTDEELQQILSDHRQWAEKRNAAKDRLRWEARNAEGRANLCNANLRDLDLSSADLSGANLNHADLERAKLEHADLFAAEINNANLRGAKLNGAKLRVAKLNEADLTETELDNADLFGAELNRAHVMTARLNKANLSEAKLNIAHLQRTELREANLLGTELKQAILIRAKLNKADLTLAHLNEADLTETELDNADLNGAKLNRAKLLGTSVAGAKIGNANLTGATYAPTSASPDSYVAGIEGLRTVTFPAGEEIGLVQLRDLLQKAGLRDLEREATFAIEHGKTRNLFKDWKNNPAGTAEGVFRFVAFEMTTAYGLLPSLAILHIIALWALLSLVYWWPITHVPERTGSAGGIYRIWPKDRLEIRENQPVLDNPAKAERLHMRGAASFGWSIYFSLLSTFQIGFREFNVGTWLARIQRSSYVLEATGWVRTVAGIQSLLSVYLLAMWLLTYFGRPFQ